MSITAQTSLALYAADDSPNKLDLAVAYAGILENIAANTISGQWKNVELSGDPKGGVVFAPRFVNAQSKAYGTARAAGSASKLEGKRVPVYINIDRENYEEVEQKDVLLSGVEGLINSRLRSQESALVRETERLFFEKACIDGNAHTFTASTAVEKLGEIVRAIETTHNDYVDGVERENIKVALDPASYEAVHTYLDPMKDPSGKEFYAYHGVEVKSSTYLPDGVDYVAMYKGSVALPIVMTDVQGVTKVQNSAAYSFGMAYSEGCAAVMPDLIQYHGSAVSGLGVTAAAGTGSGKTNVSIAVPNYANKNLIAGYMYKKATSAITLPAFGTNVTGTYSALTLNNGVGTVSSVSANDYIAVVAVDANGKVITGGTTGKITSGQIGS